MMGRSYNLKHKLFIFDKSESRGKLKDMLYQCTDEDFNGYSGENLITANLKGQDIEMSKLDYYWLKLRNKPEKEIVETIINANYEGDSSLRYDLDFKETKDLFIFSVALMQ